MHEYLEAWGKWFFIRSWTWTGKSHIIYGIIWLLKSKTLVIAPKKIINSQLYDELSQNFDNVMIPKKNIKKNLPELLKADVLVMTHIAFNMYFNEINEAWFDTLLLDEIHYLPQSRTEQFNKWKWRNIIWLSANWQRKDVSEENFPKLIGWYYNTKQEALPVKVLVYRYEYEYSIEDYIKAQEWYAPDSPEIIRKLLIYNTNRSKVLVNMVKSIEKKFDRIMIFVDRRETLEILSELMPKAYVMKGWNDNVAIKNELLNKDKYVLIAMEQVVREWMNIPGLEIGIIFFSSSEINSINQMAWRVRRFAPWKDYWYIVDFVDTLRLEWSKKKTLWYYNRKQIYKDLDFKEEQYETFFWEDPAMDTQKGLF